MTLTPLYDPGNGVMPVIGMMSGSGSNLRKILEHEKMLGRQDGSPFEVIAVFSDTSEENGSNAERIGATYRIPVITLDINAFYKARGLPKKNLSLRPEYDARVIEMIKNQGAKVAAYAGYMSIASSVLTSAMLGVNVHPADLSIEAGGVRRYRGDKAVALAIAAGEQYLRASTHILEPEVDGGRILMISQPVDVQLPDGFDEADKALLKQVAGFNQTRLKEVGDWRIFPKTLESIARGRYAQDERGLLHFDGEPIPKGWRIDGQH